MSRLSSRPGSAFCPEGSRGAGRRDPAGDAAPWRGAKKNTRPRVFQDLTTRRRMPCYPVAAFDSVLTYYSTVRRILQPNSGTSPKNFVPRPSSEREGLLAHSVIVMIMVFKSEKCCSLYVFSPLRQGKAEGPAVPPFALCPGGGPGFSGDFKLRASNSAF